MFNAVDNLDTTVHDDAPVAEIAVQAASIVEDLSLKMETGVYDDARDGEIVIVSFPSDRDTRDGEIVIVSFPSDRDTSRRRSKAFYCTTDHGPLGFATRRHSAWPHFV